VHIYFPVLSSSSSSSSFSSSSSSSLLRGLPTREEALAVRVLIKKKRREETSPPFLMSCDCSLHTSAQSYRRGAVALLLHHLLCSCLPLIACLLVWLCGCRCFWLWLWQSLSHLKLSEWLDDCLASLPSFPTLLYPPHATLSQRMC